MAIKTFLFNLSYGSWRVLLAAASTRSQEQELSAEAVFQISAISGLGKHLEMSKEPIWMLESWVQGAPLLATAAFGGKHRVIRDWKGTYRWTK